ncbi:MAG: TolC family protein [Flavobacteriales bacterium]
MFFSLNSLKVGFVCVSMLFVTTSYGQTWSLDSCIAYAFQKNLSIRLSEESIGLSELNETSAMGSFLPSLNAQGTHGYNWGQRIDPFTNQFASSRIQSNNFGIATSMNLFGGLRQVNTLKQAGLDIETAKWNYEKMRNDIALNVASAYLAVIINKEFMDIARRTLDGTDRQIKRMDKLVAAGQLAVSNLNDMQAQLASDNASYVAAENNFRLSKLSLLQLLQLDANTLDQFNIIIPQLEEVEQYTLLSNPDIAVQAALANFPEVKSADTRLASAALGKKIAASGYYPSLNASFSYGTGYSGAAKVLTGSPDILAFPIGTVVGSGELVTSFPQLVYETDDYETKAFDKQLQDNVNRSLFFSLNIPLFNGFSTYTGVKRAEVNFRQVELQREQTRQSITQSVYQAYYDAQAALANYYAFKTTVAASGKAFDWAELRYEQGLSNITEFTDARMRMEIAQANLARSKYDYVFKLKVLDFYQGKAITLKP